MRAIFSWKAFRQTSVSTFLLLLLVADFLFICIHFLRFTPFMDINPLLALDKDHGYPEIYQYIKELWIVLLLVSILVKTRVISYSAWVLIFLYALLDDALQIHEMLGASIATRLNNVSLLGLPAQDIGELACSAMVAVLCLTLLAFCYSRGSPKFKQVSRHLLLLCCALAFFGVFFDMFHVFLKTGWEVGWKVDEILGAVEDGGEMIVMSFIVAYVYSFKLHISKIPLIPQGIY